MPVLRRHPLSRTSCYVTHKDLMQEKQRLSGPAHRLAGFHLKRKAVFMTMFDHKTTKNICLETIPVSSLWQYSGKTGIFTSYPINAFGGREYVLKVGKPGFQSTALNSVQEAVSSPHILSHQKTRKKKQKKEKKTDNTPQTAV